ncbi:MAG: methylenetetrahydrofolate reductase [NAD(P)H] [Rickettsiales bacterium]|nr:methylenetetrahydrofolate reductase [NAD(P)H] [Pseudomonadota bacterium]MDA0966909.1 methylenetetrahydrofolate reductase [NAD(P)H] [Pseudomonadota bacterium]MDG4544462.1 methylenetetrahydrofolate reductase [NAD(P)H] [Rickettsiales bacterium]MDG4546613.1 methylenetetrahydrofolate reductase [NAD(P)H] [Rickettsiales bacterium]MDG4548738.1 methylenetetrahydrofolate reductase [NAD(P)H] [Rickettsiales bacterium]
MLLSKKLEQIKDSISNQPPKVSFEFFPPRTDNGVEKLKENISLLEKLSPAYCSVTYGAGGSTQEKTYEIVKYIKENTSIKPAAHLTCVNATRDEINNVAKSYLDIGVNKIVALRGDVPGGTGIYEPSVEGYAYADNLVKGLVELGDFDISVAAYPEVHPQAPDAVFDLEHLKRKIDAGAKRAITQYCFDTDKVLRFIDKARAIGIDAPIVPGVVLMNGFEQLISFSKRCGANIPEWMFDIFSGADQSPEICDMASVAVAAEQCRLLMQEGINEFHFYTLNRANPTIAVCRLLGVK